MKHLKGAGAAAMIALVAVSAQSAHAQSSRRAEDAQTYYATQVTQGPCVTQGNEFFGPILSTLLGTLITSGVNKIGTALKTAGDEKIWKVMASRNLDVTAQQFSDNSCVQVVRGRFFTNAPPLGRKPVSITDPRVSNAWSSLVRNGLHVADQPDFFFEGKIARSAGGQALTLMPLYTRLDAPIGGRALRPGKSRHVALFLTYFAPDEAELVTETNASAAIVLGELKPKVAQDFTATITASGPARDELDTDLRTPIATLPHVWPASSAPWFKLALVEGNQPLTLGVLVTETQEADAFLKFVGGVLGSDEVTGAVSAAVKGQLDPAEREKTRTAATTAAATLRTEYETALATAIDKTHACTAGSPSNDAVGEARAALRTFISKATARGYKINLLEADVLAIKITDTPALINAACTSAEAKVRTIGAAHP